MDQAFVPEKTSKLVIRVKMDSSSTPSEVSVVDSETEFNPVAVFILVVVVLSLAGIGYYFSTADDADIPPEFQAQSPFIEQPVAKVTPAGIEIREEPISTNVTEKSAEPIITEPVITEPVITEPMIAEPVNQPAVSTAEVEAKIDQPIISTSATNSIIPVEQSVKQSVEPVIDAPVEKQVALNKESTVRVESAPTEAASEKNVVVEVAAESGVRTNTAFISSSKNVKRFQLTNAMDKREPTDSIENFVPAKLEGLRRVYFFSELVNLKGQVIRHQWLREGKVQSEIKFNVGGNRWRVNSSKRLNPAAMGNWTINVLNESGDVLVFKEFEYKAP